MKFYTSYCEQRPVRLSEKTRRFAYDSLHHKYGADTMQTPYVKLDHIENYDELTPLEQYNAAIHEIVTKAPVRICQDELISGAATLGLAISHLVPAVRNQDISTAMPSISHLTVDFETVLKKGINGIKQDVESALQKVQGERERAFLNSARHCIDCFEIWHCRYLEALKDKAGFEQNYANLQRVPFQPASSFYEAVQSIWFTFAFIRLCGNWPGIGRIDYILGDYLKKDLAQGRLTYEQAREILAHFFIKGCEWVRGGDYGSGDAQHYQNIVLAGVDTDGKEIANEVTYLVLDILEELGISDFPTTVRLNSDSPQQLLKRTAEVIRHGGGVVAVYNEDLILDSLTKYGYSPDEARRFANDGCWEVQVPGKTYFTYIPFDALQVLQTDALKQYENVDFSSFEDLYAAFCQALRTKIENIYEMIVRNLERKTDGWDWKPAVPCTVVSLFEQGCIQKGRSYLEGGPVYTVASPHIGGVADVANSLYAIQKLVYEEEKLSFSELMQILKNNWDDCEPLRRYVQTHYVYYGNDNDEADGLAARILDDFADCCKALDGRCPFRFPGGVSTFGRQLEWRPMRLACPHGRKAGEILAGNLSPTPDTDMEGATAVIRSYCKADLTRQVTGAALDVKLFPSLIKGQEGTDAIISLLQGFLKLGGCFMQLDVIDNQTLKDAQEHPENYQTLSVRVSGWNARFVTLNREWQDMIIERTSQEKWR